MTARYRSREKISVTLTLMPSLITRVIAARPGTVAGILMKRFGRPTASHSLCAIATVASVSWLSPGSTSSETHPSWPKVCLKTGARTSQPVLTSSAVMVNTALPVSVPWLARSRSWSLYASPLDRAEAKMVGLVVTPTTCRPVTSDWSSPPASSSRDRSSSHTATPWADRSARGSRLVSLVI